MFGKEYSASPHILMSSFGEMSSSYKKKAKKKNPNVLLSLMYKTYISSFGIPEIGFQVRSLYFENILGKKLKGKKINAVLDAGSGIGMYSVWLAKKFPKAQVTGGDIDLEKIKFSTEFAEKNNVKNLSFVFQDVTKKTTKKNLYDLIVSIDVLEHIENYKDVLKNFSSLLTPGGYLYIHTPQPEQKRIFKRMKKWSHEGHVHEGYTPQELAETLSKLGFKVLEKQETFGFFGKLAWELNHMSFKKGFVVSGLIYPLLYPLAGLDLARNNSNGLGTAILAQKKA